MLFEQGKVEIPPEKRRIGYVFQDLRLFPHLSVLGNLRYGEKRARSRARATGLDEIIHEGFEPLTQIYTAGHASPLPFEYRDLIINIKGCQRRWLTYRTP